MSSLSAQLCEIANIVGAHFSCAINPSRRIESLRASIIANGLRCPEEDIQYASLKHLRAAQVFFSVPLLDVEGIGGLIEPLEKKYPKIVEKIRADHAKYSEDVPIFDLCIRPETAPIHPSLNFVKPSDFEIEDFNGYSQARWPLPQNFRELPTRDQIKSICHAIDDCVLNQPGISSLKSVGSSLEFGGWSLDLKSDPCVIVWVHRWTQELRLSNTKKHLGDLAK